MKDTRRVFWMHTDGGEPGDGAWFWVALDENGEAEGESVGPFETASEAGQSARNSLLRESRR